MHWRPLCLKIFFTVFFTKHILLLQGSCEHNFSKTLSTYRTFLPLIRSFHCSKWKCLIEVESLFYLHARISCTINCSVAVLSVHPKAAFVKDKHKTQILKSPQWLRTSPELPPHDREWTWAVKELLVLVL